VDPRLGRKAGEPPVGLPAHAYVTAAPADLRVTEGISSGDQGGFLVTATTSSAGDSVDSVRRIMRTVP
jgi:hypothetical protein